MGTILHLRQEWFQGKLMFLLSYTNTPQHIKEQLPLQVTDQNWLKPQYVDVVVSFENKCFIGWSCVIFLLFLHIYLRLNTLHLTNSTTDHKQM